MNGRINAHADTPEDRIAAVSRSLCVIMKEKHGRDPDYADFRDVLRPFLQREMLTVQMQEAGKTLSVFEHAKRVRELAKSLSELVFPDEYTLRFSGEHDP